MFLTNWISTADVVGLRDGIGDFIVKNTKHFGPYPEIPTAVTALFSIDTSSR